MPACDRSLCPAMPFRAPGSGCPGATAWPPPPPVVEAFALWHARKPPSGRPPSTPLPRTRGEGSFFRSRPRLSIACCLHSRRRRKATPRCDTRTRPRAGGALDIRVTGAEGCEGWRARRFRHQSRTDRRPHLAKGEGAGSVRDVSRQCETRTRTRSFRSARAPEPRAHHAVSAETLLRYPHHLCYLIEAARS